MSGVWFNREAVMTGTFRVRHMAAETLHHAREVADGIEVNLGRGCKNNRVVLERDYFFMVYEVEEAWEKRKKQKRAA